MLKLKSLRRKLLAEEELIDDESEDNKIRLHVANTEYIRFKMEASILRQKSQLH